MNQTFNEDTNRLAPAIAVILLTAGMIGCCWTLALVAVGYSFPTDPVSG